MRPASLFLGLTLLTTGCRCPAAGSDSTVLPTDSGGADAASDSAAPDSSVPTDSGGAPDSGPTDSGPPATASEEFCTATTPQLCDVIWSCCDPSMSTYTSLADCNSSGLAQCIADMAFLDGQIASGTLAYDVAGTIACIAGLASLAATCEGIVPLYYVFKCLPGAFTGTLAAGETCGPAINDVTPLVCGTGMYCRESTNTCELYMSMGDACNDVDWCDWASGARCVFDPSIGSATCQPGLPNGDGCSTFFECASFYCDGVSCAAPPPEAACGE